ncbi:Crp/Fnr family transcriptional regulator [Reinekea marinisedimentorum]|uniref:Cyclic nucleotide-binding domain-containing protein n=1 Tax=Reinekea marinisedimentorum TaxID=230495 RepID=A0A4R3IC68_9GAMM|nr:cyclic nucleotide-binding domain-containing protein [Reinekea marinisedimentorum]TCS43745.1 Cyclic nucleotide-binding domain-containing protein [Reinekea marinisedimentorum]
MEKLKPINYSSRTLAELIDQTNWANEFSWGEMLVMGRYFTAYEAKKGQIIFYEGAKADYMGLIVKGAIRISKTGSNNQVQPLIVLKDSQTFGEQSLIDGSPRSGLAEAIQDTSFVITSKRQMMKMSTEEPRLAFKLLWKISEILSNRLRHTSIKLLDTPAR